MDYVQGNEAYGNSCIGSQRIITMVEALEQEFIGNRKELLGEDGIPCTPLKVLKDMASGTGNQLHIKTFEIHLMDKSGPNSVCHRVSVKVGKYEGMGEASRHRLALQLAAADLLEKVKSEGFAVPSYGLLPGCRTNPMIYRDLKELCNMLELAGPPVYTQVPVPEGQTGNFAFTCTIGSAKTTGISDSVFLAKRGAAKKMYEILTGEIYPNDRIATGTGCVQLDDMNEMGIIPKESVRARERIMSMDGQEDFTDGRGMTTGKRNNSTKGDLYDDDFGEEEDDVFIVREQFKDLNIQKTIKNEVITEDNE